MYGCFPHRSYNWIIRRAVIEGSDELIGHLAIFNVRRNGDSQGLLLFDSMG